MHDFTATVSKNILFILGSFMDPRTKDFDFIANQRLKVIVFQQIESEIQRIWEKDSRNLNFQGNCQPPKEYSHAEILLQGDIYFTRNQPENSLQKEIQNYRLMAKPTFMQPELLNWWKECSSLFPILSKVARLVLGIPASSAPSERVFSVTTLIAAPNRSRMTEENFSDAAFVSLNKNNVSF